jgi:hypothetical protein
MSDRRIVLLVALFLGEAAVPVACAPEPVAPAPRAAMATTPALGLAESQPTSATVPTDSVTAAASASAAPEPVAPASESARLAPPPPAEPDPPCIDGELMMGACICDTGKSADATGHCILVPCPRTAEGRVSFRDPATGQCKECRSGLKPTADGKCEPR